MHVVGAAARRAATVCSPARTTLKPAFRSYATPVPFLSEPKDPQLGDYPALPYVSKQRRSARGWEDPQMRRNFGEPPHEREELLSMWGPDAPHVAPERAARNFFIAVAIFTTIGLITKASVVDRPSVPRECPYSGLVTELGGLDENKVRNANIGSSWDMHELARTQARPETESDE
ncbi:hypothetical protein BDW22DRAFT_1330354 [Trametopsis cervina]|nr:hypothetical protein BDW22DRAFT_1330354 [Trametopsis cervina]